MTGSGTVRIRPASLTDTEAIQQIHLRNDLGELDGAVWRNLWAGYPFAGKFSGVPPGWVLESENGAPVGMLGNVHLLYRFGAREVKAAIATAWAVDADYRGKSLQLMATFLKQKGVDLLLDGSASPTASKLLTALKLERIPIPQYDSPCFWVARPRSFAAAALVRKGIAGAALWAPAAGLALTARDIVRRSGRGRISAATHRTAGFDSRFDVFWNKLCEGPPRLRAVRTQAVLEWRFGAQLRNGQAALITAEAGGELAGYAVLLRRHNPGLGMHLYEVADIQALRDDPGIYRDVLLASVRMARQDGLDALKIVTGTPAKRVVVDSLRPYTYRLDFWQLYYKVVSPDLAAELSTADAWDFSLFETW